MTKCNCGADHYREPYHAVWCRKAKAANAAGMVAHG